MASVDFTTYQDENRGSDNGEDDFEYTPEWLQAFEELETFCDSGSCDNPPATNNLQIKVKFNDGPILQFI